MPCMFYRVIIAVDQVVFRYLARCSRYIVVNTDNLGTLRPVRLIATANGEYGAAWILFDDGFTI